MMKRERREGEERGQKKEEQKQVEQWPLPPQILVKPDLDPSWIRPGRQLNLVSQGEVRRSGHEDGGYAKVRSVVCREPKHVV